MFSPNDRRRKKLQWIKWKVNGRRKLSEKATKQTLSQRIKNGGKTENIIKEKQVTNLFLFLQILGWTFQTIGGTIIKITNYFSERRAMILNYEI